MFMEEFAGSLVDLSKHILLKAEDWQILLFQVLSPMLVLATVFGISHNDLYPRNVLIHAQSCRGPVTYCLGEKTYVMHWPFFAAVTDFGIASAQTLFGEHGKAPEVAQAIAGACVADDFGLRAPKEHILRFKTLPIFSRDIYTVLKWTMHSSTSMPRAPDVIRRWAAAGLSLVDALRSTLSEPQGLQHVFESLFSNSWARASGLPLALESTKPNLDVVPNFSSPPREDKKAEMLAAATAALQALPLQSAFAMTPAQPDHSHKNNHDCTKGFARK
jgi:serine/threonine protein kinase